MLASAARGSDSPSRCLLGVLVSAAAVSAAGARLEGALQGHVQRGRLEKLTAEHGGHRGGGVDVAVQAADAAPALPVPVRMPARWAPESCSLPVEQAMQPCAQGWQREGHILRGTLLHCPGLAGPRVGMLACSGRPAAVGKLVANSQPQPADPTRCCKIWHIQQGPLCSCRCLLQPGRQRGHRRGSALDLILASSQLVVAVARLLSDGPCAAQALSATGTLPRHLYG